MSKKIYKEKLPVLKEFSYNPVNSFNTGNPYTIAIVYSFMGENGVVKGGALDVETYLKDNAKHFGPYILKTMYFKDGKHRSVCKICGLKDGQFNTWSFILGFDSKRHRYSLKIYAHTAYSNNNVTEILNSKFETANRLTTNQIVYEKLFRTLPTSWISELDCFVSDVWTRKLIRKLSDIRNEKAKSKKPVNSPKVKDPKEIFDMDDLFHKEDLHF